MRRPITTLALALTVFLAACNREGVGSLAANNSRAAIVSRSDVLFTAGLAGEALVKVAEPINPAYGVTLSPFGGTVAYVQDSPFGVYTLLSGGGTASPIYAPPQAPTQGLITFLPSGDLLTLFRGSDGLAELKVFAPAGGTPLVTVSGIDQVFVAQAAVKPKRGTAGAEFFVRPYALPQIPLVLAIGSELHLYLAGPAGFVGPTVLPQVVDATMRGLFALRPENDVTSGLLSPDGQHLIFRTTDGSGHNLFAVDLGINSGPVSLVAAAAEPPGYAFSPDGLYAVYESPGSLLIYDFELGIIATFAEGASDPGWR